MSRIQALQRLPAASVPTNRLVGPRGHFLFGSLREFRRDFLGFLTGCARAYGDVVAFRLGRRQCLLLNHPDLIEEVLVIQNHHFRKHFALRLAPLVLGQGLLTSDGEFWLRQRRLAQPAFQRGRIASYGDIMVAHTERMLAEWKPDQPRDLHADLMRLTLGIVAKTLFDADVSQDVSDVGSALETTLKSFDRRFQSLIPIPLSVPTLNNLRVRRAVRRLDAVIYRFINERRKGTTNRGDLLSLLLHARDQEDGSRMTDHQLRDELMTLFLAGHETTALALAWTWYLIAQHPKVEERLWDELDSQLGGQVPTVADLPRLRFTEQIIQESMRLYPPAYLLGREALEPCRIGGYAIAKGWTLFMSQWVMHRDPRFFDHPEAFRPERWSAARDLPKYAYFPFGGGSRICIGNTFAMMEAVLILATMARHWRFRLTPGLVVVPRTTMTLRPHPGIHGVVRPRHR
jgi:cytochrome P450